MERFPRGSLPPFEFAAVATVAPTAVSKPPVVVSAAAAEPEPPVEEQAAHCEKQCDLSTTCPNCGSQMLPEHAHYKCAACGYRDSCCF